jgi:hypothetical protein
MDRHDDGERWWPSERQVRPEPHRVESGANRHSAGQAEGGLDGPLLRIAPAQGVGRECRQAPGSCRGRTPAASAVASGRISVPTGAAPRHDGCAPMAIARTPRSGRTPAAATLRNPSRATGHRHCGAHQGAVGRGAPAGFRLPRRTVPLPHSSSRSGERYPRRYRHVQCCRPVASGTGADLPRMPSLHDGMRIAGKARANDCTATDPPPVHRGHVGTATSAPTLRARISGNRHRRSW